ncbi:MAG: putative bifunctional diguanylate cyclase/phosphodiesterase [Gemmatimonadota bacterium]
MGPAGAAVAGQPGNAAARAGRVRFFRGVTLAFHRTGSLREALAIALKELCLYGHWPAAQARFSTGRHPDEFPADLWHVEDRERFKALRETSHAGSERIGNGVPKTILSCDSALWRGGLEDLTPDRRRAARAAGLRSVLGFAVHAEKRPVAVVQLFSDREDGADAIEREALEFVRVQLDLVADRARARDAVRGVARHYRKLEGELGPTRRRLREVEERYALLCRGAHEGMWDWDLQRDRIFYSPRWKSLLGCSGDEIGDRPSEWFDRVHPEDRDRVELELLEHLDWQSPRFESEHRIRHRDGSYRWMSVHGLALRDSSGKAYRIAGSLEDVTGQRAQKQRSLYEVLYHPLTGLPTRTLLTDRIEQALCRRTRRPDRLFAVIVVQLEGLRDALRTAGTEAAEEILLTMARRASVLVRPGDTVGHTGDSEFGILLEEVEDLEAAIRIADRIATSVQQPVASLETTVSLRGFLGIVMARASHERAEALLQDAGLAVRRARRTGVPVQVFDAATRTQAESLAQLEGDLRTAFERRELFLEYQPIVSLYDGRITGLEALLRWNHPERGAVPPDQFLAVADEAGLAREIGYWVLADGCRQLKEWEGRVPGADDLTLGINVGDKLLWHAEFLTRALAAIEAAGLEFRRVRFDVPENTLMSDPQKAAHLLETLRDRGLQVAIDDFGTGFSSLSHLHRFPISSLKIDRSLISGRAGATHEWDVARTVVELARLLDLEVIAEGIETREQFLALRRLGCRQAQGFYFSGPVPPDEAARLIREGYALAAGTHA